MIQIQIKNNLIKKYNKNKNKKYNKKITLYNIKYRQKIINMLFL